MDDKMQPFLMALYVALDKLEELDPSTADEDWFRLICAPSKHEEPKSLIH